MMDFFRRLFDPLWNLFRKQAQKETRHRMSGMNVIRHFWGKTVDNIVIMVEPSVIAGTKYNAHAFWSELSPLEIAKILATLADRIVEEHVQDRFDEELEGFLEELDDVEEPELNTLYFDPKTGGIIAR